MNVEKLRLKLQEVSDTVIKRVMELSNFTGKVTVAITYNFANGGITSFEINTQETKKFN